MIVKVKKRSLVALFIILVIILILPIVYAQVRKSFGVILVISNRNPIIKINNITSFAVDPVDSGVSIVLISFNVTDPDNETDVNATTAVVNFTLGYDDGTFATNVSNIGVEFGTCYNHTQPGPGTETARVIINCTVVMRYFNNASANWKINITIKDKNGAVGRNDSGIFTFNTLSALTLPRTFVNFSSVNLGQQNVPASPLILNNTGNDDFDLINITASALIGTTVNTETIGVTNFYANTTNATAGAGVQLSTSAVTLRDNAAPSDTLANATLTHGHPDAQVNADKGNLSVFFWIDVPSSGISAQLYNTTWNVTVINLP